MSLMLCTGFPFQNDMETNTLKASNMAFRGAPRSYNQRTVAPHACYKTDVYVRGDQQQQGFDGSSVLFKAISEKRPEW